MSSQDDIDLNEIFEFDDDESTSSDIYAGTFVNGALLDIYAADSDEAPDSEDEAPQLQQNTKGTREPPSPSLCAAPLLELSTTSSANASNTMLPQQNRPTTPRRKRKVQECQTPSKKGPTAKKSKQIDLEDKLPSSDELAKIAVQVLSSEDALLDPWDIVRFACSAKFFLLPAGLPRRFYEPMKEVLNCREDLFKNQKGWFTLKSEANANEPFLKWSTADPTMSTICNAVWDNNGPMTVCEIAQVTRINSASVQSLIEEDICPDSFFVIFPDGMIDMRSRAMPPSPDAPKDMTDNVDPIAQALPNNSQDWEEVVVDESASQSTAEMAQHSQIVVVVENKPPCTGEHLLKNIKLEY